MPEKKKYTLEESISSPKCDNPRTIFLDPRKDYWKYKLSVPCGTCPSCRKSKAQEWGIRIWHEISYWDKYMWLGLDYRDKCLPFDAQLKKEDLIKFIRRMRDLNKPNKIMYYGVGEYGELNGRPHYHVAIFGMNDPVLAQTQWPYGRCVGGLLEPKSISYMCGYLEKDSPLMGRWVEPFNVMSTRTGFGKKWFMDNWKIIAQEEGKIRFQGHLRTMPRYYCKLFEKYHPEVWKSLKFKVLIDQEIITSYNENHNKTEWNDEKFEELLNLYNNQRKQIFEKRRVKKQMKLAKLRLKAKSIDEGGTL